MWLRLKIRIAASVVAAALAVSAPVPAATAAPLAVGTHAPPLAVADQTGGMRNLESLTPNKGVVLLFTRSLHW